MENNLTGQIVLVTLEKELEQAESELDKAFQKRSSPGVEEKRSLSDFVNAASDIAGVAYDAGIVDDAIQNLMTRIDMLRARISVEKLKSTDSE